MVAIENPLTEVPGSSTPAGFERGLAHSFFSFDKVNFDNTSKHC